MKFQLNTSDIYIPDSAPVEEALSRTTHLCIGAHPDDIEIMATHAILECFQRQDLWFTGVIVTDGRGSPRDGNYEACSDDEMRRIRIREQQKAAYIGEYSAQVFLDHPSKALKNGSKQAVKADLEAILQATRPQKVYTHNLADKHDTHVGVALNVIEAIREVANAESEVQLYGCEVWRALDWMADGDKTLFDLSHHENLKAALLGVFDSQISGGKRYDLATLARQKANATFFESLGVDESTALSYALDMTPLVQDPGLSVTTFIQEYIQRFEREVTDRLSRFS